MAEWNPIETAPKDGSAVIVAGDNFGNPEKGKHVRVGAWSTHGMAWYDVTQDDDNGLAYLTHWMPLPEPPR